MGNSIKNGDLWIERFLEGDTGRRPARFCSRDALINLLEGGPGHPFFSYLHVRAAFLFHLNFGLCLSITSFYESYRPTEAT